MVIQKWATRGLNAGDLSALRNLTSGSIPRDSQIQRLKRRGFVKQRSPEKPPVVTIPGRVALLIKQITR